MQIETLLQVASICFRVSIALFLLGAVITVLLYRKLNIKEIYLIRSGKAKRRQIGELEQHNRETGNLRDFIDLDYTTGSLKKLVRKKEQKTEATDQDSQFKREIHSGNTGVFSTPSGEISAPSRGQDDKVSGSSFIALTGDKPATEPAEGSPSPVSDEGETVKLSDMISADYNARINTAYQQGNTGDIAAPAPAEPMVPVNIISAELIIHTNEVIAI